MKNKKILILILAIMVSASVLVGCGNNDVGGPENDLENKEKVSIVHELGEAEVSIDPEKVIVFDYGVLDTLDKMEKEIVGLPKASLPAYLDKYKDDKYIDVGSLKEPNFETIYELNPDLIIISGRQASLYNEFKKIAPTVYITIDGGDYINSFKNNMEILGQIFNKEEFVQSEIESIENSIGELKNQTENSDDKSLFIMANDGNLSAFGKGSRFGIIHNEFGLKPVDESIEVSDHGQKISFEYILEKDPDYIFVMDRAAVAGGELSAKQVMDNDLIHSTKAYKNDNIIYLDAHVWYVSSGGLTGTIKMLEEVKAAIE